MRYFPTQYRGESKGNDLARKRNGWASSKKFYWKLVRGTKNASTFNKQPKAKPSLKDQKKLVKQASESISHKVVSKDLKQGNSQMLINSGKNLPCRKSKRQLKFTALDWGVKENIPCSMCGKKQSDQQGDDKECNGKNDLIIDWWDCQKCKRWFHQICLVKVSIRRVGKKVQCIYFQSE